MPGQARSLKFTYVLPACVFVPVNVAGSLAPRGHAAQDAAHPRVHGHLREVVDDNERAVGDYVYRADRPAIAGRGPGTQRVEGDRHPAPPGGVLSENPCGRDLVGPVPMGDVEGRQRR